MDQGLSRRLGLSRDLLSRQATDSRHLARLQAASYLHAVDSNLRASYVDRSAPVLSVNMLYIDAKSNPQQPAVKVCSLH